MHPPRGTTPLDPDLRDYYLGDGLGLLGYGRPLIMAEFEQGTIESGAERFVVDNFEQAESLDCGMTVTTSSSGRPVTFAPIGGGSDAVSVCRGPANDLEPPGNPVAGSQHDTDALEIAWNGSPGVEGTWDLTTADGLPNEALAGYTHLSLRVANLAQSCPTSLDEVELDLELDFLSPDGSTITRAVSTGLLPDQHGEEVTDASGGLLCPSSQFMRTLRIPITEFCDQGQTTTSSITALRVRFPAGVSPHTVQLDSVEFVRDPDELSTPACPQTGADFECQATSNLQVTETACRYEPIGGKCPKGGSVTSAVPVPLAFGTTTPGWTVHIPPGWLADPLNPTSQEQSDILTTCISACEQEWEDSPDISATCAAAGAFAPTLHTTPGLASTQRVPAGQRHGEGLFPAGALSCDLTSDCCEQFDEDICASTSLRATTASSPLGRGEQHVTALGGTDSKIVFSTPNLTGEIPLVGQAGYSFTSSPGPAAPFYIGSLAVSGTSTLSISDTCPDGSPFSHAISDIDIELVQPSFGISDPQGTSTRAFPPGSFHLRALITVDGVTRTIRAVTEDAIYLEAEGAGLFAGALNVGFSAPCGDSTLPVTVTVELSKNGPIEEPPIVDITTPSTVRCPSSITLSAAASDPDGDISSTRWFVDDVLLTTGTTSLTISAAHQLRVEVTDSRGAKASDSAAITCR